MRLSISLALALTIALLAAGPASAGQVCMTGTTATFAAEDVASLCGAPNGPSEVNSVTVSTNGAGDIVFTDTIAITDADGAGGCSVAGTTATCPGAASYTFDLGDGADKASTATALTALPATGGDGADTLAGGSGADNLNGGLGNDTVTGGAGADILAGGAGNDTVTGDAGADTLDGGDGADAVNGGDGDDFVMGGAADDVVSGGDGNDSLDGGAGFLGCQGSGGDDTLSGDAGDDALCGGAGPVGGAPDNDAINGGDGVDHVFYPRTAAVNVSLDGGADDGSIGEADNVRPDVEDATGGSGPDRLVGNDGPNLLDGGGDSDALLGLGGNDVLTDSGGDFAADSLDGGAGDDMLAAGRGPDAYLGGDGEDGVNDYAGRSVPVTVTLDGTPDDGAAGERDNVNSDVEDVTGGSASDTLTGTAADNELNGGGGDDTITGGDGNDGLFGQAGRDTLDGGAGRDRIDGGAGSDTLKSRDGRTDRVDCAGGTDSVEGEARDDIAGDCEKVAIAPPTAVTIASVVVTRAGFVVVRVICPVVERSCAGAVIVKTVRRVAKRFIKLGQVNYRLREGQSKVFRARIAAKDRKALKRARRVKVRTVVTNANSETGASTNATKLVTVTTRGL